MPQPKLSMDSAFRGIGAVSTAVLAAVAIATYNNTTNLKEELGEVKVDLAKVKEDLTKVEETLTDDTIYLVVEPDKSNNDLPFDKGLYFGKYSHSELEDFLSNRDRPPQGFTGG